MILIQVANGTPYNSIVGNCVKQLGSPIPTVIVPPTNDICICDYIKCKYEEVVFGSDTTDDYKNDKSDFLFRRLISTDTVAMTLEKDGTEVATLNNNTYGTLYNGFTGDLTDEQELYYGFLLDWKLVLAAFGAGLYVVKATIVSLGTTINYESRYFRLLPYSDLAADGTVKIESYQNGNIEGSEFDYTNLNWYQSIRILGRFGNPEPLYESSKYVDENQTYRQIKDTMSRKWTLNTKLLSWEVASKLVYNKMLANEIYISDYSIKAENIWRQIPVQFTEIDKPLIANSPYKRYNINFTDNKVIYQKRNF